MRKTKFRGKAELSIQELDEIGLVHDNGWIVGNLIVNDGSPMIVGEVIESTDEYIALERWCSVESESVGQYTGIDDVYEGDYCIIRGKKPFFDKTLSMGENWELRGKIVFEDFAFWLVTEDGLHFWLGNDFYEIVVI